MQPLPPIVIDAGGDYRAPPNPGPGARRQAARIAAMTAAQPPIPRDTVTRQTYRAAARKAAKRLRGVWPREVAA